MPSSHSTPLLVARCGPCRQFSPVFQAAYEAQGAPREVQVVFVSSDRSVAEFDKYYGHHSWAAIPFAADEREAAMAAFSVSGIPRVVVLATADGHVVRSDARGDVVSCGGKLAGLWDVASREEVASAGGCGVA